MSSSLIAVTCPQCALPSLFVQGTTAALCDGCEKPLPLTGSQPAGYEQVTAAAVPFRINRDQAEAGFLDWLIDGEFLPDDIFANAAGSALYPVYLPHYVFDIRVEGQWSAQGGYDRTEYYTDYETRTIEENGETRTVTEPVERSQTVTDWSSSGGNFATDVHVQVCDSRRLRDDLRGFAESAEVAGERELAALDLTAVRLEPFASDDAALYQQRCPSLIEQACRETIEPSIPGNRYEDLTWQSNENINTRKLYLPYWLARYTYRDMVFDVLVDGATPNRLMSARPEDARAREMVMGKAWKPFRRSLPWGLIPVALLFVLLPLGLIALVAWLSVCGIYLRNAKVRIGAFNEQADKLHTRLLEQFRQSGKRFFHGPTD